MTAVLLVFVFHALQLETLYLQNRIIKSENQFEDETVGVFSCQTIIAESNLQNFINSIDCGIAVFDSSQATLEDPNKMLQNIDVPFKIANKNFLRILSGLDEDFQKACNAPVFKKCQFSNFKLDFSIVNSVSDESFLQNESISQSRQDTIETDQYFSLNEILQEFKPQGDTKSGKIYLQVYQDAQKKDYSSLNSDLTLNNSMMSQRDRLLKRKQMQNSSCKLNQDQVKVDQQLQRIFTNIHMKEKQKNQLHLTKGWSVFELKIRPVYYLSKICYTLQITPLNNVMYKVIKSVTEKQSLLPQIFSNYESMIPLNQIVNYTQLIEQQLSELSGIPSRTTVIDISNSSGIEQEQNPTENQSLNQKKTQKLSGLNQHTFARYQFYLTSAWCNAVQISYQYKSQLNAWHVKNKSILLNFQKVSRKTQSIENHVKEFLIQFSQQIEFKNIHVSVCQGKMPNENLYTDWKMYNQIMYQIFSNAVKFNKTDGAIAVSIYFVKELRVTNSNSKKKNNQQDNFEIGRLVTVVKDTGIGISQQNLNGLFKIKTKISKRGINNVRSHMLKPCIEGLGLQTAQTLAKCLGGKILVKSKLDCGTHVTFDVQVTIYPVKRLQPEYQQIQEGIAILKLPLQKDNSFYQQKQSLKRKLPMTIFDDSHIEIYKQKIKLESDSIGESEIFTCDEAGKEIEYAMKKLDLLEVKSEGDQPYYRPKPPQKIFFEEDASYLDDSEIQRKNLNDKSDNSQSQTEQLQVLKEETKELQVQNIKKDLFFDVLSNQSNNLQDEISATVDYSINIDALNKSLLITGKKKMFSFADVIRSSMSKQSPLTAMVNSVPSMDYSNAPRRFMSSSISMPKKGKKTKKDLITASKQRRPIKNALSFDNIIPKGKKSQNDLQQVKQELGLLQKPNRSFHNHPINDESKNSVEEEEKAKQSYSGSENQAKQKIDRKLHFPIIFSSGKFSQQPSQQEIPNVQEIDPENNIQKQRSENFAQHQPDFTFQNKQSVSHSHVNSSVGMGSVAISLQQVSQGEESNRKLQLESRSQPKQLVNSDENNQSQPRQEISVPSQNNLHEQILNINQIDPIMDSEHFFSDLSIGESEREFEKNHNLQKQNQNYNMLKLQEPPLQLLHQGIIGLLKDKGLAIFDFEQKKASNDGANSQNFIIINKNSIQPNNQMNPYQSLIGELDLSVEQSKQKQSSLSSQDLRNSGAQQEGKESMNFQPKSKQAELKMKSLFSQLPSVKKPNSKVIKDGAQSFEKKFCLCKSVLFVDDDPEAEKIVRETIQSLDQRGIDIARSSNEAMHVLSLKLQAHCCTDTYDLIFVALDCSAIEYNLIQRIVETIDLWNQKLKSKGKPPIEQPHIVGISAQAMTKTQKLGTNSFLLKPLNKHMVTEIYTQLGSYLL